MRLKKNRKHTALVWILCSICILFSRVCFDNVQADPYLAYQETVSGITGQAADASVFGAPQKGVPSQQAYVPEGSGQSSLVLVPRRMAQRINPRCYNSDVSGILPGGHLSDTLFSGHTALSFDGLSENFSNTVILHYIHGQDGEK